MTATDAPPPPLDALRYKPEGAEGLSFVASLKGRDDVQTWSESTTEWLDGTNAAVSDSQHELLWWRRDPDRPSTERVAWHEVLGRHLPDGREIVGLYMEADDGVLWCNVTGEDKVLVPWDGGVIGVVEVAA